MKRIIFPAVLAFISFKLMSQHSVPEDAIRFSEARGFDYDPNTDAVYYNDYNNGKVITFGKGGYIYHNGDLTTKGKIVAFGDKIRFSEDRGFDYDPNTDAVYFNDYNNGKVITFSKGGSIGIGTTDTGSWKLAVNGKIRAKEIKVETGWSDFVFFDDYQLPTLQEVENYIKKKGHLKDIPSAKEVEENGIFLGEMDSKLLQKIEELTLYTIEQEKQLNKQSEEIAELKTLVKKLLETKK